MSEEANKTAPVEAAPEVPQPAEAAPAEAPAESKDAESKTEDKAEDKSQPMLKTTAKIDQENHSQNVKSDPSSLPETDDPNLIRGQVYPPITLSLGPPPLANLSLQVEYYFGDSNLPRDKFMWETTGGEENKPVSLKTICSFKRMRRFQPYTAVVAALRDSATLDVIGEEGAEQLKRKTPYQSSTDRKRKQEANTLYVKGFGDESATTQFDIEAFFTRHGPVNYIKLRRTPERLFKGSVFVEFPDEEAAKKFAASAPKWGDHELKIMTKHEYCEEKNQLIREGKLQPSSSSRAFFEGRDGSKPRGGGRGGFNKGNGQRSEGGRGGFRGRGGRGGRGRGRGRGGRGGHEGRGGEKKAEEAPAETSNNEFVSRPYPFPPPYFREAWTNSPLVSSRGSTRASPPRTPSPTASARARTTARPVRRPPRRSTSMPTRRRSIPPKSTVHQNLLGEGTL